MFGYRVPAPNEALLISGRKQRGTDELPFKIVTGHGAFVVPVFSRASRLTLAMQEAAAPHELAAEQAAARTTTVATPATPISSRAPA